MTPADKETLRKELVLLKEALPPHKRVTEEMVSVWMDRLQAYPIADIVDVLRRWPDENAYQPRIDQVLPILRKKREGHERQRERLIEQHDKAVPSSVPKRPDSEAASRAREVLNNAHGRQKDRREFALDLALRVRDGEFIPNSDAFVDFAKRELGTLYDAIVAA